MNRGSLKLFFLCITHSLNAAQGLAIAGFVFWFPMAVMFLLLLPDMGPDVGYWIGGIGFMVLNIYMLVLNIVGLVLFQIPWSCRQGKGFLYTAGGLVILLSVSMLAIGISMASIYACGDGCFLDMGAIFCAVCVVGAICWAVAAFQIVFVRSGQHAGWEMNESPINVPNTTPTNTDPPVVDLEAAVVPVIEKVVLPQPKEIVELSPLTSPSDPSSIARDEPAPKPKRKKSETKKSESKKPKKCIYKDEEIKVLNPEYKEWKKARKKDEQKLLAVVSI